MQVKATVALNNTTQSTAKLLLHKTSINQKKTINDDKQNASISFLLKVLIRNFMLFGNTIFNSLNIFIILLVYLGGYWLETMEKLLQEL